MRYHTELMRRILTNEKAQQIIDYVSPIYGESYVGLWLFQAIGTVLGEVCAIAEQLRYETNPTTADLLLSYWESEYGIATDPNLTKEQRRAQVIAKIRNHGPVNPGRMEDAVSAALGGVDVEITENVHTNTFLVNIREHVDSITPAVAVIERLKPAHLIYQIRVATKTIAEADLKIAIALTHAEQYTVPVLSTGNGGNNTTVTLKAEIIGGVFYLSQTPGTGGFTAEISDGVFYLKAPPTGSNYTAEIENGVFYLREAK